jgi:hypothetical protein
MPVFVLLFSSHILQPTVMIRSIPCSPSAFRSVVAFGPRKDRNRDLILNLMMERFDLSLKSTFSDEKQLRAVLQVSSSQCRCASKIF